MTIDIKVPSWNTCYRISNSRIYKTQEAKDFQEIVGLSYKGELFEGDVEVSIEFQRCPPIDLDNAVKLTLDALEGFAYHKDRQVSVLTVSRQKCKRGEDRLSILVLEARE